MGKKLTNELFIARVMEKNEHVRNGEVEILGKYVNMHTKIKCRCNKHNITWDAQPQCLLGGAGCKKCGSEKLSNEFSLSHDEFMEKVLENNEYVKNGDVEILGKFVNYKTPIKCKCYKHNIIWLAWPTSLLKGRSCRKCGYENNGESRSMTYEEFIKRVNALNNGITAIGDFLGLNNPMDFECQLEHQWTAVASAILNGEGCPYCAGVKVLVGFNDLWSTRPDVARLLTDPEDGYKYSAGSGKKINFTCPDCDEIHLKTICDVCVYGFSCKVCSDGISYPNKFGRALLKQLDIQNVIYEWNPDWLKPYSYDNYFIYNNIEYVLEMDGGLGHGKVKFNSREKDVDGAKRDIYKDSLATKHNIKIIRIDCDYSKNNRFEYIKNNILKSELSSLFDLSSIDWVLCDKQAQSKLTLQAAKLYNDGLCLQEISNILKYTKITIVKWLNQATRIGLCNYDPKDAQKRGLKFAKNITTQN